MQLPSVSVIIPMFNAASFLDETIASIYNQSYSRIELIIVDDHSNDDSYTKAMNYLSDSTIVKKNQGKGACAARNYGIELSSGDYIQFLDADDILCPNKIKFQVETLIHTRDKLSVCNTYHFKTNIDNGVCFDKPYIYTTDQPDQFFINLWGGFDLPLHMVLTSAWLTPRSLIDSAGPWNENLYKDQDGEYFARIALKSKGIIYVPGVKNYYRKHSDGKNIGSQKKRKHIESIFEATELKASYLLEGTSEIAANRAIATLYKQVAIDAWPQFKNIYKKAIIKCKAYGGSNFNPVLGGSVIENIKIMFGWQFAKFVSYYGHKIFKR